MLELHVTGSYRRARFRNKHSRFVPVQMKVLVTLPDLIASRPELAPLATPGAVLSEWLTSS